MCLYTNKLTPFIAKQDIPVYKGLTKLHTGKYVTPYVFAPVKLNAVLYPGTGEIIRKIGLQYAIGLGYIHGVVSHIIDPRHIYAKAFIPEGTEFYLGESGNTFCAKKLYISDDFSSVRNTIDRLLLESIFCKDEIMCGDVVLKDLSIKHPQDVKSRNDAIGVVIDVNDEKITVCSLEEKTTFWSNYGEFTFDIPENLTYDNLFALTKDDLENYPAIAYCNSYNILYENMKWRLPTSEEIKNFINNVNVINLTLSYLNYHIFRSNYWTMDIKENRFVKVGSILGAIKDTCIDGYAHTRPVMIIER